MPSQMRRCSRVEFPGVIAPRKITASSKSLPYRQRFFLAVLLMLSSATVAGAQSKDIVFVGRFSQGTLAGWDSRSFNWETDYRFVEDSDLHSIVLAATADGIASGTTIQCESTWSSSGAASA